jgi:cytochrome P450
LPDEEDIKRRVEAQSGKAPERMSAFDGGQSMITMDPPNHTKSRRKVAPGFTPQRLDALEDRIAERVSDILDGLEGKSECEFVSAVAAELPVQMLAELFGAKQEDRHKLFEWSNLIIGGEDPEITTSREQVMSAIMEMAGYGFALGEERKKEPGSDLITMLVQPNAEGDVMSPQDYISAFVLLVVAGNETTRNSISGGILALSQFPEQKRRLIDDPSLLTTAVSEIIRWVAPVAYMRRTAKEDAEIGGQKIKKGDKVAMWYMSGNRDESIYTNPMEFDIARNEARHLSFGYGQHLCIGWRLAEIQLTVLLRQLLQRYPKIEATGEVARMRTNFLNSIKRMQVTY